MSRKILVLGATGMLGQPVARCLVDKGNRVRVLARSVEKTRQMFGDTVEIVEGSAVARDDLRAAMDGCDAVHVNLTQEAELVATQLVTDLATGNGLERVTYVSATGACEENRWFEVIDVKMRCEEILRASGVAHVVFRPTWVMETLQNFVRDQRVAVILGKNPPPLHFFAAAEFGRMVAASYDDDRALGRCLFVHGPEAVALPEALERFARACHPDLKVMRLKLWQARLIAKLTGRKPLAYVTRLIAFYDQVVELGDPTEANAFYGAPSITLDEWFEMPKDGRQGLPH